MRRRPVYSIVTPAQQCGLLLFVVSYHQLKKAVLSCLKYYLSFRLLVKVSEERESRPTYILNLSYKEVPDVGLCEPKHAAPCEQTLKCCVGRYIFVCL
jgi:hypothetical protein